MESSIPPTVTVFRSSNNLHKPRITANPNPNPNRNLNFINRSKLLIGSRHISAIGEVTPTADPAQVEITREIFIGALAGVTPFVVAGIEFSKRIVVQRRCGVCKGSGLVLREKYYFRCPRCGGFLPWQSWKRFFLG